MVIMHSKITLMTSYTAACPLQLIHLINFCWIFCRTLDLTLVLRSGVHLIQKWYVWAYYLIRLIGLFQFQIPSYKKSVSFVRTGRIREWSQKNELQSLLGLLLYITKCVKSARYFLNRMLQLLRDNTDNSHICLTSDFFKDLKWFQVFLSSYNDFLLSTPTS